MRPEENSEELQELRTRNVHYVVAHDFGASNSTGVSVVAVLLDGRIRMCYADRGELVRSRKTCARERHARTDDVSAVEETRQDVSQCN